MREKWRRRLLPKTPWGDRIFARYRFYRRLGRSPENPPVRFNDHLFALKAGGMGYDPLIQYVTDKEYAKQYVSSVVGSNYTTETYRILRNKEELKTYVPDRFPCILKPTHSSGQAVICADRSGSLDREKLGRWLYINYYSLSREQNYRHLVPKIIVEEFFSKDGQTVPDDYKIFCFRGVPKLIQVDSGRFSQHTRNLYDTSWNRLPVTYVYPNRTKDDLKPALLGEMLHVAQELSAPFPFVRVDMYSTESEMRVGELTIFPESASGLLRPAEAEFTLGEHFRCQGAE